MMVLLFGIALWGLFAVTLGREDGALATSFQVMRTATYNESAWFRSAALTHSRSSAAALCPELPPLLVPHANARNGGNSSALPQAVSSYQKLLWFVALAPPRPGPVRGREKQSLRFVDALKVSVLSARLNAPSLEPHLIYLGQPDTVTGWMESKGVTVHFRVLSFWSSLSRTQRTFRHSDNYINYGAYGRLEIPLVMSELLGAGQGKLFASDGSSVDPEFVLYTDSDVIFAQDVPPRSIHPPNVIAAALEGFFPGINSGVLYMNVQAMIREHPRIIAFGHASKWDFELLDQTLIENYFAQDAAPNIDILPDIYNARGLFNDCNATFMPANRSLWSTIDVEAKLKDSNLHSPGTCSNAIIWHFHGYKPWDVKCWFMTIQKGQRDWRDRCRWHKFISPGPCFLLTYAHLLESWSMILAPEKNGLK